MRPEDLIESAPDAMVVCDARGQMVLVNAQAERLFGYRRDELVGQALEMLLPARYRHRHAQLREGYLAAPRHRPMGGDGDPAYWGARKDGTEFLADVGLSPIESAEGRLVVAAIRDATKRRRTERELRRTTRALRTISLCNQALARATDESKLLNDTCRMLVDSGGYRLAWVGLAERDEPRSVRVVASAGDTSYLDGLLVTWGEDATGRGPTGTAIRTRKPVTAQEIASDPNFAPWRAAALRHGFGSSIALPLTAEDHVLGALMAYSSEANAFDAEESALLAELAEDVAFGLATLRTRAQARRAEEALRESEARYRVLFQDSPAGNYVSTPAGRLLACNQAFASILGFGSPEELEGVNLESLYPDPLVRQQFLQRLERSGRIADLESDLRRRDGSIVHVLENVVGERDPSGRLVEIRGFLLDQTQRKHAERQLRHVQKMDAVGRLAGGVAHDFNNILGIISGFAELAQRQLAADHPVQGRLEQILAAAKRGAALTRQLLTFGRRRELHPQALDLNAVYTRMEKMLGTLLGEDVELAARLAPDLGAVMADPTELEQVLMNLAANARDAMPGGGSLLFETANAELDEGYVSRHVTARPGAYVMLAASDTGVGMDEATRSKIFEPFFTTKPEGKGTGLGLATVYGIVKQSGGFIWVYSELGHGTTFKIYLPRVDAAPERTSLRPRAPEPAGGAETILVVEDQDELRAMTTEVLGQLGYTVLAASGGPDALDLARRHDGPIHLLLSDVVMRGMNGREVAEALTALRPGMRTLYMSGYADQAVLDRGLVSEDMRLVEKPFSAASLAQAIRRSLA